MAHSSAPAHGSATASPFRLSVLLGSALLAGLGVASLALFLVTMDWLWFLVGVPSSLFGGLLLFHRTTGADAA